MQFSADYADWLNIKISAWLKLRGYKFHDGVEFHPNGCCYYACLNFDAPSWFNALTRSERVSIVVKVHQDQLWLCLLRTSLKSLRAPARPVAELSLGSASRASLKASIQLFTFDDVSLQVLLTPRSDGLVLLQSCVRYCN